MMPGVAGDDLAKRIRSNQSLQETKLVLISSAGTHGIPAASVQFLDARLDKPVRQHELLDCLMRIHGGRHADAKPKDLRIQGASHVAVHSLRILLAEDNKINQMFATALLKKAGHQVDVAANGLEAVDAVQHGNYDVVLMDVQMPELDGIGAMREIRAFGPPKASIPIIAMTANAMAGAEAEYLKAGMDDYVSKPVQPDLLLQKLSKLAQSIALRPATVEPSPKAIDATKDAVSNLPVLDVEKLETLAAALSPGAVRDFLSLYRTDTENHLAEIDAALVSDNFARAARLAHEVVSTAGNIGVEQVSAMARLLETACLSADPNAVAIFQRLAACNIASVSSIDGWLSESIGNPVEAAAAC